MLLKNYPGAVEDAPNTAANALALEAFLYAGEESNPAREVPLAADVPQKTDTASSTASWAAEEATPYLHSAHNARYLGQLFRLFILVEKNDRLFIIDQHAAHDRILYDRFLRGPIPKQELLVAIPFSTESPQDDSFFEEKREELSKLGIVIRRSGGEWLIESLPAMWKLSDRETRAEILNLKNSDENIAERWAATLSCRSAVKDGDLLDERTALALAEEAFALPVQRCPHGRPIWFEISREDLLRMVKRS
jgi:DNA mismatch repair protein MutL